MEEQRLIAHLSRVVNIIAVDIPTTQGAKVSGVLVLTRFALFFNFKVLHRIPEWVHSKCDLPNAVAKLIYWVFYQQSAEKLIGVKFTPEIKMISNGCLWTDIRILLWLILKNVLIAFLVTCCKNRSIIDWCRFLSWDHFNGWVWWRPCGVLTDDDGCSHQSKSWLLIYVLGATIFGQN